MSKRALTGIALLEAVVIVILAVALASGDSFLADTPTIDRAGAGTPVAASARVEPATSGAEPRLAGASEVTPGPAEGGAWELASDDPLRIVVYGSAATADGDPVEGPSIWLRSPDGTYRTASSSGGAYVFVGVEPGRYNLSCRAEGFTPPPPRDIALDASESSRREDIIFQRTTQILVRTETPEGESLTTKAIEAHIPVAQWAVVATRDAPTGDLPLTRLRNHEDYGLGKWVTSSRRRDGSGGIPPGYLGRVDVKIQPPFFLSLAWRHIVLETIEVRTGVADVTFRVPLDAVLEQRAPVRLKVVDAETGEPLPDVGVSLSDAQSRSFGPKTDEHGVYEAEHHPPGLLQLVLGGVEGKVGHWELVRLEGGRLNDFGTIRLQKARTIEGRVVDARGEPVQGRLTWQDPALLKFPQGLHPSWGTSADEKGAFSIAVGRVPGLLLFTAKGKPPVTVLLEAGSSDVGDFEVVVPDGVLVSIQPQGDEGWHHVFALETAEGVPLLARTIRGPWPIARHLAPGRYVLRVYAPDGTERRHPFLVGKEELEIPIER